MLKINIVDDQEKEIFIPGRLCILGEHTDWIGKYRGINKSIPIGKALVCVTNEGLYTKFKPVYSSSPDESFIFCYSFFDEQLGKNITLNTILTINTLKLISSDDTNFFRYVCGTASVILKKYPLKINYGISIHCYRSTLPMKKGLSSSAAICITIASCFNEVYDLQLSMNDLMEMAFQGEMLTSSRCGRMDQCMVMGKESTALMTFDNNSLDLQVLSCVSPLYFVVADLNAGKDTVYILNELNKCFPYASNSTQQLMHEYSKESQVLVLDAVMAIQEGDVSKLANSMTRFQYMFDKCAMPNCIKELTSPKLHSLISNTDLQKHSLAIKGVGSQGDGTVQVLCRSETDQKIVLDILKSLNCDGFLLTIPVNLK